MITQERTEAGAGEDPHTEMHNLRAHRKRRLRPGTSPAPQNPSLLSTQGTEGIAVTLCSQGACGADRREH